MFTEERKQKIASYVQQAGRVSVNQLCEIFDVSSATIRNDLRDLERQRLVMRVHGGAMRPARSAEEPLIDVRDTDALPRKESIATLALSQVDDGDAIIVDSGTTCYEFGRILSQRNRLTVITNDLRIALALEDNVSNEVVVMGGRLRAGYHATDDYDHPPIAGIAADKVFLGVNAFNLEQGAMTPNLRQATLKHAMARAASKVILLCDSSKFGRSSVFAFVSPEDVDLIITDSIDERFLDDVVAHGIDVLAPDRATAADGASLSATVSASPDASDGTS